MRESESESQSQPAHFRPLLFPLPLPLQSPAALARSTGAEVSNQSVLQARLQRLDAEFKELHAVMHTAGEREHASPAPAGSARLSRSTGGGNRLMTTAPLSSPFAATQTALARSIGSGRPSSTSQPTNTTLSATQSTQRHRERLARASGADSASVARSTFGGGSARDTRESRPLRSNSPATRSSPGRVHVNDLSAGFSSPVRSDSHAQQQSGVYSPAALAKQAAASAISSPVRNGYQFDTSAFAATAAAAHNSSNYPLPSPNTYAPPSFRSPSRSSQQDPYYPNPSASPPVPSSSYGSLHQPPNPNSYSASAFREQSATLQPMPPLPSSALTNGLNGGNNNAAAQFGNQGQQSQGQSTQQQSYAAGSTPYVLSQAYPPQFTSMLVQRDKRLDAYLADYIRDSGYRLDKLKRKIAALQSNADSYLAAHDFELTGLKRDALVEEVNHEIALLERGFRAERLEAEEKLAAFLAKDKADRIDAFKSVLQSEGEESIERVRKDYLLRRQQETDEIRAEITRRRDEEMTRVRREMEAESERAREEMRSILERDARQSIEEERLSLENAAVEKIKSLRAELMKGAEDELALLREKMARSLSDQLADEERQAASKREDRLREIKAEIRSKLDRRAADRTAELELHQSRVLHEWEVSQTAEYDKAAAALEAQYSTKLLELQSKAQSDFDAQKTTKLQALEFKLLEEMKANLASQMLALKNEFLASRQGLKENLELELRERHAFELAQYRAALVEERQTELETLTAELKRQSDAELVEVTHELQAQKQASLAAIHAQFEQERERWLMKLQAAYGQWPRAALMQADADRVGSFRSVLTNSSVSLLFLCFCSPPPNRDRQAARRGQSAKTIRSRKGAIDHRPACHAR